MLGCFFFPRDFFVSTFFKHLEKDVSQKAPKQETAQKLSPLLLGKTHVNRHVELIFCSRFVLKVRFFWSWCVFLRVFAPGLSFNDSPWKAMELHRVFV